jgi:DNA-binding response OmpR family regulator
MLKEKGIKTPVIVLTNLGQPEDEKRVRELGAIDFLIKSDTPLSKIVERIKQEFS